MESAKARFNPDRTTSYSVSLFDVGNPSRMACSSCSPVGDFRRWPTSDPDDREVPSIYKIHHPALPDSELWVGYRGTSTMKLAMACPFMNNLGWYSNSYSLNFMTHWSILSDMFGLCKILRRGWSVSMTIGWAWKYGWSFWAALRKAKVVCPFLST